MAGQRLNLEVDLHLFISDDTAAQCLRILEMWQESNPDKTIIGERDGTKIRYHIKQYESVPEPCRANTV